MWLAALAGSALVLAARPAAAVVPQAVNKAIDRGVAYLKSMQAGDGSWGKIPTPEGGSSQPGPTALVALALLECDVAPNDPAITKAAALIRKGSITCMDTYGIATSLWFLDRLGEPGDVPLIESLGVRLLAGQNEQGGWTYKCPAAPADDVRRLETAIEKRTELTTRPDRKPGTRPTLKDLPEPIKAQLTKLAATPPGPGVGDNSNTQFANIALWIARRHGIPVEGALGRIELRYRKNQQRTDGGWTYVPGGTFISTPTMTCAGIIGLLVAYGATLDAKGPKPRALDLDPQAVAALTLLGSVVGQPVGNTKDGSIPKIGGRTYYFLWSLERVCVGMDLKLLGKNNWYDWGAEILIANQGLDGSWQGEYARYQADTCFALLFLKRSNLVHDLTAGVRDKFKKLGERTLETGPGKLPKGFAPLEPPGDKPGPGTKPPDRNPLPVADDQPSARLAQELVTASGDTQAGVLERLRDGKGVEYTEALTAAIAHLAGDRKQEARNALAERLKRMKPETLKRYLSDEEPEIRRAAVAACEKRELKTLIPDLIPLLKDRAEVVAQAAHAALKGLSGEDLGPDPAAWEAWWSKQPKE
jgi:hypothetical protein